MEGVSQQASKFIMVLMVEYWAKYGCLKNERPWLSLGRDRMAAPGPLLTACETAKFLRLPSTLPSPVKLHSSSLFHPFRMDQVSKGAQSYNAPILQLMWNVETNWPTVGEMVTNLFSVSAVWSEPSWLMSAEIEELQVTPARRLRAADLLTKPRLAASSSSTLLPGPSPSQAAEIPSAASLISPSCTEQPCPPPSTLCCQILCEFCCWDFCHPLHSYEKRRSIFYNTFLLKMFLLRV